MNMPLRNDTLLAAPSVGHFTLQRMSPEGILRGPIERLNTEVGLILNCHHNCEQAHITRMAEMARDNPNQPYDISAWVGPSGYRQMIWNARLYWRD